MPSRKPYDESTKQQAMQLGYAMQLTNFLRDIAEDWNERKRVYISQEIMKKHGITIHDLKENQYPAGWKPMMDELIAQCRVWYTEAEKGIQKLPKQLQPAVRISSILYQAYLDQIIESDYKIWQNTYSLTKWQKAKIVIRTFFFSC